MGYGLQVRGAGVSERKDTEESIHQSKNDAGADRDYGMEGDWDISVGMAESDDGGDLPDLIKIGRAHV